MIFSLSQSCIYYIESWNVQIKILDCWIIFNYITMMSMHDQTSCPQVVFISYIWFYYEVIYDGFNNLYFFWDYQIFQLIFFVDSLSFCFIDILKSNIQELQDVRALTFLFTFNPHSAGSFTLTLEYSSNCESWIFNWILPCFQIRNGII